LENMACGEPFQFQITHFHPSSSRCSYCPITSSWFLLGIQGIKPAF
jgi:hypothetical protein